MRAYLILRSHQSRGQEARFEARRGRRVALPLLRRSLDPTRSSLPSRPTTVPECNPAESAAASNADAAQEGDQRMRGGNAHDAALVTSPSDQTSHPNTLCTDSHAAPSQPQQSRQALRG